MCAQWDVSLLRGSTLTLRGSWNGGKKPCRELSASLTALSIIIRDFLGSKARNSAHSTDLKTLLRCQPKFSIARGSCHYLRIATLLSYLVGFFPLASARRKTNFREYSMDILETNIVAPLISCANFSQRLLCLFSKKRQPASPQMKIDSCMPLI